MTGKHTEGPWNAVIDPGGVIYVDADHQPGGGICDLYHIPDNTSKPFIKHNAEANAHFIVRACNSHADLLEALEQLIADYDQLQIYGAIFGPIALETHLMHHNQAINAIAKAKGEWLGAQACAADAVEAVYDAAQACASDAVTPPETVKLWHTEWK